MASTYKTNYLGLNKFVGSDKPKMDDFNFDNETLDQKFQEHVQSSLHITEEERQMLGKSNYVIGTYTGNGESPRTIDVGLMWSLESFCTGRANFNAACFSRCNRDLCSIHHSAGMQ